MAATWIKPIHQSGGKSADESVKKILDYIQDGAKTQDGYLVDAYFCNPMTADIEFDDARQDYFHNTGRKPEGEILAYHVRQAFMPGEITAEAAQELGKKFVMELTGSNHAYVIATHDDTAHIHNHIIINAVNLECNGKYRNKIRSYKDLAKLSDRLCVEHGYSFIAEPNFGTGSYKPKEERQPSHRSILVNHIDQALAAMPRDFEHFLKLLSDSGCKIKQRGKTISIQPPSGAKRFFRLRAGENGLPDGYGEEELRKRIADMWVGVDAPRRDVAPAPVEKIEAVTLVEQGGAGEIDVVIADETPENVTADTAHQTDTPPTIFTQQADTPPKTAARVADQPQQSALNILLGEKIKALIDIENSAKAQTSRGYENWAKGFNLQQAAQSLILLQQNNIGNVEELAQIITQAENEFAALNEKISTADTRLKEISALQKNIGRYSKNRAIYSQYLRSKRNKDFYAANKEAIQTCMDAKKFFDDLGLEKIPTIKELQTEYALLVGEKQAGMMQKEELRKQLSDLQAALKNVQTLMGIPTSENERSAEQRADQSPKDTR